ncbi:MAG: hypothetical protein AAF250_09575 [Pseudomonadota bacterium]
MSSLSLSGNTPLFHVNDPDGDLMFDPKWFVGGFALGGLALIFSYDVRIGTTVGVVLAVLGVIYLSFRFWLASEPTSEREVLFNRFSRSSRNRREARSKELSAKDGSDAG